jgi:hypothetical protein
MQADSPLSVFETVNVVSLKPGDVLLFRCHQNLTKDQRDEATKVLDLVFAGHECMILDGGQDIAVLRPASGLFARVWRIFSWKAEA